MVRRKTVQKTSLLVWKKNIVLTQKLPCGCDFVELFAQTSSSDGGVSHAKKCCRRKHSGLICSRVQLCAYYLKLFEFSCMLTVKDQLCTDYVSLVIFS